MKLGPVTKLDKRITATSKNVDGEVMSKHCDIIVFFPIYGQFAVIRKPDSGRMVYKTYISLIFFIYLIFYILIIFYLTKNKNRTKKSLTQLLYYCFE